VFVFDQKEKRKKKELFPHFSETNVCSLLFLSFLHWFSGLPSSLAYHPTRTTLILGSITPAESTPVDTSSMHADSMYTRRGIIISLNCRRRASVKLAMIIPFLKINTPPPPNSKYGTAHKKIYKMLVEEEEEEEEEERGCK
jgi:hypothetical protein